MKKLIVLLLSGLLIGFFGGSCSYHNDDNPNVYPDVKPDPEPKPDPKPDVNMKYVEASFASNCYLVKPSATVAIPILKAYAMWSLYAQWLGTSDFATATPEPVLIWQDTPGLITSVGMIPAQTNEAASIAVSTSSKVGNAVVGIRIGGEIRWSWHLWITRYNPDAEPVAYGKTYKWDNNGDGRFDYTFMDRNLGAVTDKSIIEATTSDSLSACGLLYQWGRKDPFPSDRTFRRTNETDYKYFNSRPIYNTDGVELTELPEAAGTGIRSIATSADPTHTNLYKAVTSPTVFLLGIGSYNDWFAATQPSVVQRCDSLWSGYRGKTPFDPCPAGWRVPADKNGLFVWNGLSNATTDYSSLGVFPYTGFRYAVGGGCLKNSGFGSNLWSATSPNGIGNAYELSVYISPSERRPVIRRDIDSRSNGQSVRCVKEN